MDIFLLVFIIIVFTGLFLLCCCYIIYIINYLLSAYLKFYYKYSDNNDNKLKYIYNILFGSVETPIITNIIIHNIDNNNQINSL